MKNYTVIFENELLVKELQKHLHAVKYDSMETFTHCRPESSEKDGFFVIRMHEADFVAFRKYLEKWTDVAIEDILGFHLAYKLSSTLAPK